MSSLFCPKCLFDTCGCVARKLSDMERENEELKQKLEHYNLTGKLELIETIDLDEQLRLENEELKQKLEVAKMALEFIKVGEANYGPNTEIDPSGSDITTMLYPDELRESARQALKEIEIGE